MVISGKWLTTSLTLGIKSPNKKQKAGTSITDITNQYFRKLLKDFNNHLKYVTRKNIDRLQDS